MGALGVEPGGPDAQDKDVSQSALKRLISLEKPVKGEERWTGGARNPISLYVPIPKCMGHGFRLQLGRIKAFN